MALPLFDIVALPRCLCVQSSVRLSRKSRIAIQTPSILVETGLGLLVPVQLLVQPMRVLRLWAGSLSAALDFFVAQE